MKFCNFYYGKTIVAGVLLEGGVAPLFLLIPEVPGVTCVESGKPLPLGVTENDINNLEYLIQWQQALQVIDKDILNMTERISVKDVHFAPPVMQPNSFRDFYAFEEHVRVARSKRNLSVVPEWYEIPVFYFSNHRCFITDRDELKFPNGGERLDFELEVAAIITKQVTNPSLKEAKDCIGGYCLLNDWSLRDVQRQEMAVGLGPAKGKDFATGLGPWLVTPDDIENERRNKGFNLEMSAAINGKKVSKGNWSTIHYSFEEMLVRAGENVTLYPGDVIGSGTVGSGCILELGPENTGGWLKPDDVVELEIEKLGRIRNRIVSE